MHDWSVPPAYNMRKWKTPKPGEGVQPRKPGKNALKEGLTNFRTLWQKVVKGEEPVRPALIDTVNAVDEKMRKVSIVPTGTIDEVFQSVL